MANTPDIISIDDTESYDNVIPGPLKLKGNLLDSITKRRKMKYASSSVAATNIRSHEIVNDVIESNVHRNIAYENDDGEEEDDELSLHGKTEAELRFELMRMEREKKEIERLAQKSYRERVDEFNKKIANESEHHDIPKVGPG